MSEKKERYIPSLRALREAAKSLPPAGTWRAESCEVPTEKERKVNFRKVKIRTREGRQDRWIYEGKVFVE